jgi:hypothetical protein
MTRDRQARMAQSLPWLLGAAAILYFLLLPRRAVGDLADDALYLLGAKALLGGSYAALQLPNHPPLTVPMPGFSFFLAPFVAFAQPHWGWFKGLSILLTLGSGFLLWTLVKPWLQPGSRIALLFLFAFNPAVAMASTTVMSEPCFIFFLLLIFLVLSRWPENPTPRAICLIGGLAGWAAVMRPSGAALIPALALGAAVARRRDMGGILLVTVMIWGGVLARNFWLTHSATSYLQQFEQSAPLGRHHLEIWRQHTVQLTRVSILQTVCGVPLGPPNPAGKAFRTVLVLMFGAVMVRGTMRLSHVLKARMALAVMGSFCGFYFLMHSFWLILEPRYVLPLQPFLGLALLAGAESLKFLRKPALVLGAGFILAGFWKGNQGALQEAFENSRRVRLAPYYAEIRDCTSAQSLILAANASDLYLHTGRFALGFIAVRDERDFREELVHQGVTHVLCRPASVLQDQTENAMDNQQTFWERVPRWAASSPGVFHPVYQNPQESVVLYEVTQN